MNMDTPLLSSTRIVYICICLLVYLSVPGKLATAEENVQALSTPATRTVVADVLEVEGDFHIVRGERGEIRIEVTADTQVSEEFTYGDRIKAVLLPNDVALTITRAAPSESIGIMMNEPSTPNSPPTSQEQNQSTEEDEKVTSPLYEAYQVPKVRIIVAKILMIDGSFYIIRSEQGEIQIEITPETTLNEDFKFNDKIKARVTPANKALAVTRAGIDEVIGIFEEVEANSAPSAAPVRPTQSAKPTPEKTEKSDSPASNEPAIRIIVADVLMAEGDFYIVRGERGEIQIEVTAETTVSESFDYGDRIKAEVLPNDKALSIERAAPNDPIGISTP